ncbi:hypothetical protein I6E49_11550 [Prevotella stercorea]|uniref:hypothetical protein n=1 Tax=Leyella stercorea TaxID=363265 RepID=UPI001F3867CE|nr:hypothetical protein [Leyella stercorea]MCF2645918.1 hypothetical protein [Leyella stercorea]
MRPVRAKALIINAFALAGRFAIFNPYTQGAALGYVLLGLSARFVGLRDGFGMRSGEIGLTYVCTKDWE